MTGREHKMKFKKSYLMMAPAIVMGAQATLATAAVKGNEFVGGGR